MPTPVTTNRSYQKPDPLNYLDGDVLRIVAALDAIDTDVAGLLTSVAGKAATVHTHVINDVTGLQTALDGKASSSHSHTLDDLSDANTAAATDNMFLRRVSGTWVGVTFDGSMIATGTVPAARIGTHTHAISDVTSLQTTLDGKQPLDADLTAIAALAGTSGLLKKTAANTWTLDTSTYSVSGHTHAISDVTGLQTALDAKVALSDVTGKQTINLVAGSMKARTTNGAAYGSEELATNDVMADYWAFDATTSEAVQAAVRMPKSWNEGTVEVEFQWKHPTTTTNFGVKWGVRARAVGDNEALDGAWGTAQEVADTGGTTGNLYKSAFTAALTIGNTPAEGDLVIFEFYRAPADASDTMAVDAHLMGVTITYTTNAAKDD